MSADYDGVVSPPFIEVNSYNRGLVEQFLFLLSLSLFNDDTNPFGCRDYITVPSWSEKTVNRARKILSGQYDFIDVEFNGSS